MNRLERLISCLAAVLLLGGLVGCGKPGESKPGEPAKSGLAGHWTGFDVRHPGAKSTLTINDNQLEYRGPQPSDWVRGTIVLNEQVHPMQMDLRVTEAGITNNVGATILAIYELRGDELKLAASGPEHPANFAGGEGIHVFTFKRD